jgi:1-acyl-sn-glycerol-3-phosphate acyltransferase
LPEIDHSATEVRAHAYARQHAVPPGLYVVMRALTVLVLRLWFRIKVAGGDHVPVEGPAIVAPNHKNFLDPFFIGIATRRYVRYMAKAELMKGPLGWFFLHLGAFPVRRGAADAEAMETARAILTEGGLVVVFPEGTRVEPPDALGSPHHGAGRLALDSGAPIIPAAITGTSHLWRGAVPRLKRVQIAFLPAVVADPSHGPDEVSQLIDERVWPAVQEEYGRLRAAPGLIAAALAALGLGGGLLARRRRDAKRQIRVLGRVESRRQRHRKGRSRRLPRLRRPR